MLNDKRINALVKQAETEGVEGNIRGVLQRAVTVGELLEYLRKLDPNIPVEVEIPVEINGADEMISEVGFVVDIFKTEGETKDGEVLTLLACKPDQFEPYMEWLDRNSAPEDLN